MKESRGKAARLLALGLCMALVLTPTLGANLAQAASGGETWAIYWYLCGSDLESENGAATEDLDEMLSVDLPENVTVVIQTGGAYEWQNDVVESSVLGRYVYDYEGFYLVDEAPNASMGDPDTLADFLSFCVENYPADRQAVIFWNHGGGSVAGVAFDEQFDDDALTLTEIEEAFAAVVGGEPEDPPFELVGFDACLMATIDTAYTLIGYSRYMVASEELEPGCGWDYEAFLTALADDPGMDGAALGEAICDSYYAACEAYDVADSITLSVVDLEAAMPLVIAYNNMGVEALASACDDTKFFTSFGRYARSAENYGGNNADEGYTNMVDLGDLIRKSSSLLPETAEGLLSALDDCVIYKVNGPYRAQSTGLSCYYNYDGDLENLLGFLDVSAVAPMVFLYYYGLMGELPEGGMEFINEMGYTELPELPSVQVAAQQTSGDEDIDFPVTVDEDGYAVLDVGPEIADALVEVRFHLAYVDWDGDMILMLGTDNDLYADWDEGVFNDNFQNMWAAIDGNLVYMDLTYVGEDYNLYAVPVLLNGEEYNLSVSLDYDTEEYTILGARKGIDSEGKGDKNLVKLRPGDELTTIFYVMSISGDDEEPMQVPIDTFTYTKNTTLELEDMGDGEFMMMFELIDMHNNSLWSQPVWITVEDGDIYLEADE